MKSNKIAAATATLMAVALLGFAVYLGSHSPNDWALPVFLAVDAVILTVGMTFAWRARRR